MVLLPGCWTAILGSSSVRWPVLANVQSPPLGVCGGAGGLSATGRAAVSSEDPAHPAGAAIRGPY